MCLYYLLFNLEKFSLQLSYNRTIDNKLFQVLHWSTTSRRDPASCDNLSTDTKLVTNTSND